jgi:hypothetical protein
LKLLKAVVALAIVCFVAPALAQTEKMNFKNRQAVVINNAVGLLELNSFKFENSYRQSRVRLQTDLSWTNVSDKPISAFEVVILRYDPFNRPIPGGGRWLIPGKNSGDWSSLMPKETSEDGLIGYDDEPVMTAIAYVRAIRFENGNIWTADTRKVEQAIRSRLPVLKELGDVSPSLEKERRQYE